MPIDLASTTVGVLPEYAATNITINRSMQPDENNHYNPVISATINYARTDYVADTNGNKLNIVQRAPFTPVQPAPGQPWVQDSYTGSVQVSSAQMAALPNQTLTPTQIDALIRADLVTRGIITS